MRLFLSTLAIGTVSLALPMIAAHAAPMANPAAPAPAAFIEKADWNGYHHDWHRHWAHEWRGDYGPDWHHRHWHRPPPPPYGYYAPPPGGYYYRY